MLYFFQWFQDYPEYQANPFFISGESYAGIYVPTLSRNVAHGMSGPYQTPFIDLPFSLLLPR
jgi:carboxypeptidase C (cathepsin A)